MSDRNDRLLPHNATAGLGSTVPATALTQQQPKIWGQRCLRARASRGNDQAFAPARKHHRTRWGMADAPPVLQCYSVHTCFPVSWSAILTSDPGTGFPVVPFVFSVATRLAITGDVSVSPYPTSTLKKRKKSNKNENKISAASLCQAIWSARGDWIRRRYNGHG